MHMHEQTGKKDEEQVNTSISVTCHLSIVKIKQENREYVQKCAPVISEAIFKKKTELYPIPVLSAA